MAIAGFTAVPNRNLSRTELVGTTNTFFSEVGQFVTDANALAVDVNADAEAAGQSVTDAADQVSLAADQVSLATAQVVLAADEAVAAALSADAAAASATAAAQIAAAWVSGAAYTTGGLVFSIIDFKTYRAKTTHSGLTDDPSIDDTNWLRISALSVASEALAETGTDNETSMTPLRTAQAIAVLSPGLSTASTTGAAQTINFSGNAVHLSTTDAATVTYTFDSPADVAKVDLIIDYRQVLAGFDLSDASYDSVSFSVSGQESAPTSIAFNADGTKMFIIGTTSDSVFQYTLSTGFNVSTASYDSVSFSVSGQYIGPTSIAFNADGTKMFIIGTTYDSVFQYTLSTGFNVSTASYDSVSFSVSGQEATPTSIAFNADGSKMFIIGKSSDSVFQYTLSTGFNVSTASYDSVSFSVSGQDISPTSIAFNADGTKMFIMGKSSDSVFQYTLSTGATLVFPTMQGPAIPLVTLQKTAVTIVTADGGTSYQVISTQGGIE